MSADHASAAEQRMWAALPESTRAVLSATDLQTLLIAVMRACAESVTPAQVRRSGLALRLRR